MANDTKNIRFIISMDKDDESMNNAEVISKLKEYEKQVDIKWYFGNNKSKVEAINADITDVDWDILLLASDDMIPVVKGYEEIIIEHMQDHFPDTDGCLWYDDGYVTHLNTLSIMGKKYYQRFGYIYYPEYKSLWCDNEYQEVFTLLNKYCHFEQVIIKHEHPNWTGKGVDILLIKNDREDPHDRKLFKTRKEINFNI